MDGTQKLPQRLIEPAMIALEQGLPLDPYAFAVAAWMRYALGVKENGEKYALRDPREQEIAALIKGVGAAGTIVDKLLGLPGLFPEELARSDKWQDAVKSRLETDARQGHARGDRRASGGNPTVADPIIATGLHRPIVDIEVRYVAESPIAGDQCCASRQSVGGDEHIERAQAFAAAFHAGAKLPIDPCRFFTPRQYVDLGKEIGCCFGKAGGVRFVGESKLNFAESDCRHAEILQRPLSQVPQHMGRSFRNSLAYCVRVEHVAVGHQKMSSRS